MDLLYTNQINTIVLDQFLEPTIVGNIINDNISVVQDIKNCIVVTVNDTYKYRPEKLAFEYYGHESFYPLILAANNIGSLFYFIPSKFNNEIKLLHPIVIKKLFNI